jgi:hypothetical protein
MIMNPYNEDNKSLVRVCTIIIARHEDRYEECTCYDPDDYTGCWYNLSDEEQTKQRLQYLIDALTDIQNNVTEAEPNPVLGHITSVTQDDQGITVQGTLTEAGQYFMMAADATTNLYDTQSRSKNDH